MAIFRQDLGKFRYFLSIEVAQSKDGVIICQWKYTLNILEKAGMLNAKLVDTPIDSNIKLLLGQGSHLKIMESMEGLWDD